MPLIEEQEVDFGEPTERGIVAIAEVDVSEVPEEFRGLFEDAQQTGAQVDILIPPDVDQERVRKSMQIGNILNIPSSQVYDNVDIYEREIERKKTEHRAKEATLMGGELPFVGSPANQNLPEQDVFVSPTEFYDAEFRMNLEKEMFLKGRRPNLVVKRRISPEHSIVAIPEGVTSFVTGMAGALPAGIIGLVSGTIQMDLEEVPETFGEVQRALTYVPRTEAGQKIADILFTPIEKVVEGLIFLGEEAWEIADKSKTEQLNKYRDFAIEHPEKMLAENNLLKKDFTSPEQYAQETYNALELVPPELIGTGVTVSTGILLSFLVKKAGNVPQQIRSSQWWREMTVKERGLVTISNERMIQGLKESGLSDGQIARQLKAQGLPEYFNELNKQRIKGEKPLAEIVKTPEQVEGTLGELIEPKPSEIFKVPEIREKIIANKLAGRDAFKGLTEPELQFAVQEAVKGRAVEPVSKDRIKELEDKQINAIDADTATELVIEGNNIETHLVDALQEGKQLEVIKNNLKELLVSKLAEDATLKTSEKAIIEDKLDKQVADAFEKFITEEPVKPAKPVIPIKEKPLEVQNVETFKQELQVVRDMVDTPEFKPENLGLAQGITNQDIVNAISKGEANKKLTAHEKNIYFQAIDFANERLSDSFAKRPLPDLEQFIDDTMTKLLEEHVSKAELEKKIVSTIKNVVDKGTKGKAIITDDAILLRKQLRDEAKGARVAERVTRQQLLNEFKKSNKNLKDTRKMLIDFIKQELPREAQGKFINALKDDLTLKKQTSIYGRVDKLREDLTRKDLIAQSKELSKPTAGMDVEYQKRIRDVVVGVDFAKPTQKTIDKLESLAEFLERNPENNVPPARIDALKRLSKQNVNNMTTDELAELKETLEALTHLGRLKQQLKIKYNQREQQKALDKLLASTRNIDPKSTGIEKLDTFKNGTLLFYLNTLHTPRVGDFIDNYQAYSGENAGLIKNMGRAETDAKMEMATIMNTALDEIKVLELESFTKSDQVRIMINIRNQERAFEQVKTLMVKHGYEEIPAITVKEQQLISILQKHTTANVDEIGALREDIDNVIFEKLDNYILPIKYERDFNLKPSNVIEQSHRRKRQTEKGFVFSRQEGVEKVPRTDVLAIFEEAINEQQWYLKMQPVIENTKPLVLSREYLDKGGEFASKFWTDQIDIVARRGWSATASHNAATRLLSQVRINLNQSILGYKASSILMQPFAIFDSMASMQAQYGSQAALEVLQEFSKAWIRPDLAKQYIDTSPALQTRAGGEIAIEETLAKIGRTEGFVSSFNRGGLSLLRKADLITAAGVQRGVEKVLIKHGVPNPKEEAEFIMNMVSGSAEVSYRPHVLASGEGARTWFTFQTFFLNRWGIMAHELIVSGAIKSKGWKKKVSALVGLGIFMAGSIAEQEAREFIFEKTTKKEIPDRPLPMVLLTVPENVPYFGNILSAAVTGGNANPPVIRTIENAFRGGASIFKGKKTETKVKGAFKLTESGLELFLGVPGTAQGFDIMEGIFFEPKGKKSGIKPR